MMKIVTLVGGTVGGYISFAGAHRLLDAGISGKEALPQVTRSSVSGILITSVMRFVLFFAVLGVVWQGAILDSGNPAGSKILTSPPMASSSLAASKARNRLYERSRKEP